MRVVTRPPSAPYLADVTVGGPLAEPVGLPLQLLLLALELPLGSAQALQVALVGDLPLLQLVELVLQVLAAAPELVLALRQPRLALLQRPLAGLPLALAPPLLLQVLRLLPLQVGQVLALLLQAALLLLLDEGAGPRRRPRERPLGQQQLLVLDVAVLLQHHPLRGRRTRGDDAPPPGGRGRHPRLRPSPGF